MGFANQLDRVYSRDNRHPGTWSNLVNVNEIGKSYFKLLGKIKGKTRFLVDAQLTGISLLMESIDGTRTFLRN
jgi:hypothetical protein